jgi:hypothetical protein
MFYFYRRKSGKTRKTRFTLNQGGKIFFEITVITESLTSLRRTSPPNFIDFKKYKFSSDTVDWPMLESLRKRVLEIFKENRSLRVQSLNAYKVRTTRRQYNLKMFLDSSSASL